MKTCKIQKCQKHTHTHILCVVCSYFFLYRSCHIISGSLLSTLFGCFQKIGVFPQIIHFNRMSFFHYRHHPYWGYPTPMFWKKTPKIWRKKIFPRKIGHEKPRPQHLGCLLGVVLLVGWHWRCAHGYVFAPSLVSFLKTHDTDSSMGRVWYIYRSMDSWIEPLIFMVNV